MTSVIICPYGYGLEFHNEFSTVLPEASLMHRNTKITMLPSVGKPDSKLATQAMTPLIVDALINKKEESGSTSNNEEPYTEVEESDKS